MPLQAVVNTFAGGRLDRAGDKRLDTEWLAEQAASGAAEAIALWQGRPLVTQTDAGLRLSRLPTPMAIELGGEDLLVFLGLEDENPLFAVEVEGTADPAAGPLQGHGRFEELRGVALALPGHETAMAGGAKSLIEWRKRHGFCSACGERTLQAGGGWKRLCPACRAEHFPRVDPVVIMLPVHGDRCLLGRQASWPPGRMSALAGFMEPGESVEEACARELFEEAGLRATRVRYHSSQPWPFSSQLMIGLIAEVDSDEATPDQTELEAVRWFTRDEARATLAPDGHDGVRAAPPLAIAHTLLRAWIDGYEA
jgi:NAD+ diphosphatase